MIAMSPHDSLGNSIENLRILTFLCYFQTIVMATMALLVEVPEW